MKIYQTIGSVMLGMAAMTATFTSCSDEIDYTPAEALTNAQVYFPSTLPSTQTVDVDGSSFTVQISRVKTDDAITVPLNVTQQEGSIYTIPSSVSFAQGSATADIVITYAQGSVEYDSFEDITIGVGDASYTTPYGTSDYTFKAGVNAPWVSLGMASYTDDYVTTFYGIDNLTYEVEIQENSLHPGLYRLVDPYGANYPYNDTGDWDASTPSYLEINAENPDQVYIETQAQSTNWGYGNFVCSSLAGYYIAKGTPEKAEGYYGTLKDGEITFPKEALLFGMSEYNNGGLYVSNGNGAFSVVLPGYTKRDLSCSVAYAGIFSSKDNTTEGVADVVLGTDVEKGLLCLVDQSQSDDDVAAAMLNGTIEPMEVTESGRYQIAFDGDGKYKFVLAAVYDGAVASVSSSKFTYTSSTSTEWESIGVGTYTDEVLLDLYVEDPTQYATPYEVEFEKSTLSPGVYRMKNVYTSAFPYNEDGDYDASQDYYVEFNAEDPEAVYIPFQYTGLDWGDGEFGIYSMGAYYLDNGYSVDDIKANGIFGTLTDGVITFPVKGIVSALGDDGYYYGNTNGLTQIVLPSAYNASRHRAVAKAKRTSKTVSHKMKKAIKANMNTRKMVKMADCFVK